MENKLKQKQIEELMKDMCADYPCNRICDQYCGMYDYAERAINAGYRKISENEMVLTKEEFSEKIENTWLNYQEFTRKETAQKFAERLKEYFCDKSVSAYDCDDTFIVSEDLDDCCKVIDEIAKEFTEGKV